MQSRRIQGQNLPDRSEQDQECDRSLILTGPIEMAQNEFQEERQRVYNDGEIKRREHQKTKREGMKIIVVGLDKS